ncbi:MAG: hypothetical protein ACI4RP_00060 [Acutalibacteraceae bacterium]
MSVRKGDRGEGKLQVLNKARELKKYSLALIKSEKNFPKSTRWIYASPIINEVRAACICIRHANSVYVTGYEEYTYRRMEQVQAHAHLDALLDLIDDVYDAGYITGKQVEFWTGLILQTDDLLKAWIKSDKEKYKEK